MPKLDYVDGEAMNHFPALSRESHHCRGGVHARFLTFWGKLLVFVLLIAVASGVAVFVGNHSIDIRDFFYR